METDMSRKLKPVSPGEMLADEFPKPLGMSDYRLAKEIGVPAQRIGEILAGKRAITADTDLRLCRFFGLSDGWWPRLQADYDTEVAKGAVSEGACEDQAVAENSRAHHGASMTRNRMRPIHSGKDPARGVSRAAGNDRARTLASDPCAGDTHQ